MTVPVERGRRALHREPSYVLLMIGIFLAGFGFSSLINGRHPAVDAVVGVVGLTLVVVTRFARSGRRR